MSDKPPPNVSMVIKRDKRGKEIERAAFPKKPDADALAAEWRSQGFDVVQIPLQSP